jgi:hypothetical protein
LSLKFTCYEWLDVRDQSVLLALCALAGLSNEELRAKSRGALGKQLWRHLQPTEQAVTDRAAVIHTTLYQLMQTANFTDLSTQGYKRLNLILYRLSQVGCLASTENGYHWSMNLLSYALRPDGSINVALNGRFASAFTGQHTRTSLVERRSLPTEIAALLHCYLTAWVRPGGTQRSGVDKLTQRIWGLDSANESTARKRRERTREALEAINRLEGWTVKIVGRGSASIATVTRPSVLSRP